MFTKVVMTHYPCQEASIGVPGEVLRAQREPPSPKVRYLLSLTSPGAHTSRAGVRRSGLRSARCEVVPVPTGTDSHRAGWSGRQDYRGAGMRPSGGGMSEAGEGIGDVSERCGAGQAE